MNEDVNGMYNYNTLLEFIEQNPSNDWSSSHSDRDFASAYTEVKTLLAGTVKSVETGAMINEVRDELNRCKSEIDTIFSDNINVAKRISDVLSRDMTIFLNDHGRGHLDKVAEKAFEIIRNYSGNGEPISPYEAFILLCAIEIHDIGNIKGRSGHETKLFSIFEDKCRNVIDAVDRRAIVSIAQAHGGKTPSGNKDTISVLQNNQLNYGFIIRPRLLASILRFADELADDFTRANRVALDLGIIGTNSEIYHKYSSSLHTVKIIKEGDNSCTINLVYDIDVDELKNQYKVFGKDKYLLDEIYDRTLKMERERRYCIKFMHPFVYLDRIKVIINIYQNCIQMETISYTLEDLSYPDCPVNGSINEIVGVSIFSGKEEYEKYYTERE